MKLTILGCNGPYPSEGGACSGYLLTSSTGKTKLLIDCGSGVLANLSEHCSCGELDAVVLTHLHYDHMSDILPLRYVLQLNPRSSLLDIYAPDTPENVNALLGDQAFAIRRIENTTIGEFSLSFMRVRHPVECYALRIEENGKCFVFTGDTNECPGLSDFCRNADLLMADSGFLEADWTYEKPHLSALRCALLARMSGAGKLVLTHFNPKYDVDDLLAEALGIFMNTDLATVGKTFEI